MNLREFMRFHLLKALLGLVAIQVIIVAIVQNYNHRPLAQRDTANVIENRTVKIIPLSNDSDKDETDELSVQTVNKPLHGSVTQKGNILYYTPEKYFVGADSLTYTNSDKDKESKSASIFIQVNENLEPLAQPDDVELYSGTCLIDVLKNDRDRENDTLNVTDFTQPANGKVTLASNQFTFEAKAVSNIVDSFFYTVSDGKSQSLKTSVKITIKGKNDPCYPWLSNDIGDASLPGSLASENKSFVITASGSDIWGNADGLRFTYQQVKGDCEMVTKVESLEASNEWAKAGIMVRQSLSAGSPLALVFASPGNGINTHFRLMPNEGMQGGENNRDGKAPYWVKLSRKGNLFSFYNSANGVNWKPLGTSEIKMEADVYIGFAVCSHNNSELGNAVFSNYRMVGKVAR
ncbi:MAG: Ig-like domain-containing protein [Salinivirgaceae bacterium]